MALTSLALLLCLGRWGAGEHSVFCLRENGGTPFRLQKRFDYNPSALLVYTRDPGTGIPGSHWDNYMVASFTGQLMIYNDVSMVWAARTGMVPIAMGVASFG